MKPNLHRVLTALRLVKSKLRRTGTVVLLCLIFQLTANAQESSLKELREKFDAITASKGFDSKDSTYIDLLNQLASSYRYYNSDSLYFFAEKALTQSKSAGNTKGESSAMMRLGDFYSDHGKTRAAIEHYKTALTLSEALAGNDLDLRIRNNLAGEYAYKGDYASALHYYLDAIEIAESRQNLNMQSILNENIGNLYASQKDYDQALDYFNKVKAINEKIDDRVFQAETMSNLAELYAEMGELEYAMFNVNKSITIFEEEKIYDWLAFAYATKGKIYLKRDNYKWALFWYNQSEMLHKNLDDDRAKIDLYDGMAKAYLESDQDSLAHAFALNAFHIANRINSLEGTQECAETLFKIHQKSKNYATALAFSALNQRFSDSLARRENKQSLALLKTKTEYEKQKAFLIAENEKQLAKQQRYINIGLVVLLISIVVTYLVYRSKNLQKRLTVELSEKKDILEKRKTELIANNETKTKLFSIIGHDLRGPIGALQGLLKMFKDGEVNQNEFMEFIPKLRADVDHIYFTLNNLLSWGHSQLNGSVTKPEVVALETIVLENINLLSEIAESKQIRMISEICDNTLIWSDPNQIDIVVRNLISNALKFTPENGLVSISAREFNEEWEISVRDTGVGMDKLTVETLFDKNNNHSTYGTHNEKGTGLGLSLCKEMVEKNNGKIWVSSTLRKGTTFYFTIPKGTRRFNKAV